MYWGSYEARSEIAAAFFRSGEFAAPAVNVDASSLRRWNYAREMHRWKLERANGKEDRDVSPTQ